MNIIMVPNLLDYHEGGNDKPCDALEYLCNLSSETFYRDSDICFYPNRIYGSQSNTGQKQSIHFTFSQNLPFCYLQFFDSLSTTLSWVALTQYCTEQGFRRTFSCLSSSQVIQLVNKQNPCCLAFFCKWWCIQDQYDICSCSWLKFQEIFLQTEPKYLMLGFAVYPFYSFFF